MKDFSELAGDFERQRLAFVHAELDTGATFAEIARTELTLGSEPRAGHNLALAANACSEARRRLGECDPHRMTDAFDSAVSKLKALETQIAELQGKRG